MCSLKYMYVKKNLRLALPRLSTGIYMATPMLNPFLYPVVCALYRHLHGNSPSPRTRIIKTK